MEKNLSAQLGKTAGAQTSIYVYHSLTLLSDS